MEILETTPAPIQEHRASEKPAAKAKQDHIQLLRGLPGGLGKKQLEALRKHQESTNQEQQQEVLEEERRPITHLEAASAVLELEEKDDSPMTHPEVAATVLDLLEEEEQNPSLEKTHLELAAALLEEQPFNPELSRRAVGGVALLELAATSITYEEQDQLYATMKQRSPITHLELQKSWEEYQHPKPLEKTTRFLQQVSESEKHAPLEEEKQAREAQSTPRSRL